MIPPKISVGNNKGWNDHFDNLKYAASPCYDLVFVLNTTVRFMNCALNVSCENEDDIMKADPAYGKGVAAALGIKIEDHRK